MRPSGRVEETVVEDIPAKPRVRQAMRRFLAELDEIAGDKALEVILYGSTARGEASATSDVDLLVVWDGPVEEALDALIPISTDLLIETGVDLSIHPITPESFRTIRRMRTGFYENVEREGLVVA